MSSAVAPSITALVEAIDRGDPAAFPALYARVYDQMRRLARGQRRHGPQQATLSTTALVHEAYLKLVGGARVRDREHLFALAARAMRQILIDHARALGRDKRGAGVRPLALDEVGDELATEAERFLALDIALERLERLEPRLVRVVECRHLLGLTEPETASALGLSLRTVQRDARAATLWLRRELDGEAR